MIPKIRNCSPTVVYQDELVFVVPAGHPLATETQVSIRQLGLNHLPRTTWLRRIATR